MSDQALPDIWVRAHPFGDATSKDAHGEYFDASTKFYDDLLPVTPISYYHNFTPDGAPIGEPVAIGITTGRKYQSDGRWDQAQFFDDVSQDIKERIQRAIEKGTLRASPTVVPDFHRVEANGRISHWLSGSIAIFDAEGRRQPANPRAIGMTEMKALYKAANLEFPTQLMKAGGNPNHDEEGKFSSGNGEGDKKESESDDSQELSTKNLLSAVPKTMQDKDNLLDTWSRASNRGEINSKFDTASYGVAYARNTGRLSGNAEAKIRGMSKAQFAKLVVGVAKNTKLIGEVPAYLNQTLSGEQKSALQGVSMAEQKQNWMKTFVHTLKALFDTMPSDGVVVANNTFEVTNGTGIIVDTPATEDMTEWEELFGKTEIVDELETQDEQNDSQEDTAMADEKQLQELRTEHDNQMKALMDQNTALAQRVDRADVEKWIDTEVNKEGVKVAPAERDEVIALALNLKTAAHPTMKSADGKDTTLFDAFKKSIEARSPLVPLNGMKFAGFDTPEGKDAVPSQDRVNKLLAHTALGTQVLKEGNGHK